MRLSQIGAAVASILVAAVEHGWRNRLQYGICWLVTLFISVLLYPSDATLLASVQQFGAGTDPLARTLSEVGRFENSSLAAAALVAAIGLLARSERLRRAAVACLLAGIVAGLVVSVLRPGLGRARPHAEQADGFYWFESHTSLQSMPSGHAATNVASAVGLSVLVPPVAIPALAFAGAVSWSRMQLNRHYPTDLLWGIVLGASIGLSVGIAVRDRGL